MQALLIDDDFERRESIKIQLTKAGFNVVCPVDGAEYVHYMNMVSTGEQFYDVIVHRSRLDLWRINEDIEASLIIARLRKMGRCGASVILSKNEERERNEYPNYVLYSGNSSVEYWCSIKKEIELRETSGVEAEKVS